MAIVSVASIKPSDDSSLPTRNLRDDVLVTSLIAMERAALENADDLAEAAVLRLPRASWPIARWLTSVRADDSLFVRPCYRVLFVLATTFMANELEPLDVVVTGSVGVGKRSFLSYVFHRLRSQPSPQQIIIDVPGCFACVAVDGTVRFGDRAKSFQPELAERATFYLCDGASEPFHMPLRGKDILAKTLAVLPPVRTRIDAFKHDAQRVTFVMPAWSMEELRSARASCYPHVTGEELRMRHDLWGGLVRWALAEPLVLAQSQFTRSLTLLSLDRAASLVEKKGYSMDANEASYLIEMGVEDNTTFQLRDAKLCSPRVAAALVTAAPSSDQEVLHFLQKHRDNFRLHGLLRQIEEQLLRHLVCSHGA